MPTENTIVGTVSVVAGCTYMWITLNDSKNSSKLNSITASVSFILVGLAAFTSAPEYNQTISDIFGYTGLTLASFTITNMFYSYS